MGVSDMSIRRKLDSARETQFGLQSNNRFAMEDRAFLEGVLNDHLSVCIWDPGE